MSSNWKAFFISLIGAGFATFTRVQFGFLRSWELGYLAFGQPANSYVYVDAVPSLAVSLIAAVIIWWLYLRSSVFQFGERTILVWLAMILATFYIASAYHLYLPIAAFSATFGFSFIALLAFRGYYETTKKEFLTKAFKAYVAPELVDALCKQPDKLGLRGERRDMTILFSDLEGFSAIAEKLNPEDLVVLMNEYFTEITKIVFRYGGTIDKFIGDSVMAFWNAPLLVRNHEQLAVNCAIEIRDFSQAFAQSHRDKLGKLIRTRVGINTGIGIVGNIGSKDRFSYTVVGDEINVASRLESINSAYGLEIMISDSTHSGCVREAEASEGAIENKFLFRNIDHVILKGRSKPTLIYTPVASTVETRELNRIYMSASEFYRQGEFALASEKFQECLDLDPQDAPSRTMLLRCQEFKTRRPQNWNGIFKFNNK